MRKQIQEVVLKDFPEAGKLIAEGLITERSAEIYVIRKRFKEIKPQYPLLKDAISQLESEFPKSDRTIYRYISSIVIK